jgi:hypothetical protein
MLLIAVCLGKTVARTVVVHKSRVVILTELIVMFDSFRHMPLTGLGLCRVELSRC